MIINTQQSPGQLIISYVKKDGQVGYSKFNVPSNHQYGYRYSPTRAGATPNVISWDNKAVKVVPSMFLDKHRLQEFFMDAGEENVSHLFENNMPKLYSCDIEVDVTDDGFAEPEDAKNRINSIAWTSYPEIVCFGLKPLSLEQCQAIQKNIDEHVSKKFPNKKYTFTYKSYNNEADMLFDFLYNYARHAPLITGWFFWDYDWQYIYNRCTKKLSMDISWMSPTKQWFTHTINTGKKNEDGKEIKIRLQLPQHKLIVDYMSIYKKWDRTVEVKENSSLDFVAESALGIRKVKYPGTLQDLFNKDFEQYIFYNAIDSVLVELIHETIKTMGTFLGLANITRVEAMQAFSPIAMLEATLTRYAYPKGKIFPKVELRNEGGEYKGAFVFEPKPNLYPWVASFDFASLYPSIMRQFLMSIENFIEKNPQRTASQSEIKCKSGAIFDASYEPLIPEILTDYYGKRKAAKKVSLDAEREMVALQEIFAKRKSSSQQVLQ